MGKYLKYRSKPTLDFIATNTFRVYGEKKRDFPSYHQPKDVWPPEVRQWLVLELGTDGS